MGFSKCSKLAELAELAELADLANAENAENAENAVPFTRTAGRDKDSQGDFGKSDSGGPPFARAIGSSQHCSG